MLLCIKGSITIESDEFLIYLKENEGMVINSETIHKVQGSPRSLVYVMHLGRIGALNTKSYIANNRCFKDSYHIRMYFELMFSELKNKNTFFQDKVNAFAVIMLADLFRGEKFSINQFYTPTHTNLYRDLLIEIQCNYKEMTFEKAACKMNMSEAYFSKYFKKKTGMTFSYYLNAVRIEKAINIMNEMENNITITSVMELSGFNSIRNFNKVFKEITGYTPTTLPANYRLCIRSLTNNSIKSKT